MKKIFSIVVALMLVLAVTCPAFATEDTFVPSISEKAPPDVVVDDDGNIGGIVDENGEVLDEVEEDCIISISIADVQNTTGELTQEQEQLLEVYEKLASGEMEIPSEKLGADLENFEIVIRDLIDLTWHCPDHPDMIEPEGVSFQVTLDLGIGAEETVYVMTFKNNEWNPIVSVVNNGDGTVTCTFEHLCPVAILTAEDKDVPITGGALDTEVFVWMAVMGIAAAAMVAVFALRGKGRAA